MSRKESLGKKLKILKFLGLRVKSFQPLRGKLVAGLSKLPSTCPKEHFQEFLFEKDQFHSVLDIDEKISNF